MVFRPIDVFFYGLFMDPELLRGNGLTPINGRRARVSGMTLRIGSRATLVRNPAGAVHGFVYGLTHHEIEQLYREPSVAAYRPEAVIAELEDGSRIPALCFNLPQSSDSEPANPEYADKLRSVGSRFGLPTDYLASIR
jgi:Gamma-glutamyl cyclotransferase, AIG2-like